MTVFFAVHNIRDVKHTLEFYWNTFQVCWWVNGCNVTDPLSHLIHYLP